MKDSDEVTTRSRSRRPPAERDANDRATFSFGSRLKALLDETGMGQNELERKAGLSKGAVSLYVSERRQQPRRDTLKKMADAMGVRVSSLVDGETPLLPSESDDSLAKRPSTVDVEGQRKRLREAIEHAGKGDKTASTEAGLTPNYVHNFTKTERGKRGMTLRDARRLGEVLKVSHLWLLEGRGPLGEPASTVASEIVPGAGPASDPCPARYRALLAIAHRIDGRVRDWLLSLNGTPYEAYTELEWFEEAKRVHALLVKIDADPGLPVRRPGAEGSDSPEP